MCMLPYDAQGDQSQTLIYDQWLHTLAPKNPYLKSLESVILPSKCFV